MADITWGQAAAEYRRTGKIVQTFKHLKEKPVPQYQALLPVDLEKHLYSGSTLYDLEKHEFRKISSVTKASLKAGYTTTVTFVGGAKRILKTIAALEEFAKGHNWVTLREVPPDPRTTTLHHYSRVWGRGSGDTGMTLAGQQMVAEMIEDALKEAAQIPRESVLKTLANKYDKPKRRWFR